MPYPSMPRDEITQRLANKPHTSATIPRPYSATVLWNNLVNPTIPPQFR